MADYSVESKDESNVKQIKSTKDINAIRAYWNDKRDRLEMTEDLSGLSKNQQKKLLRKKVFLETRAERRKEEREKIKLKRKEKREAGIPLPESRRSKKKKKLEFSDYKVVIDLDFYDLMNDKDLRMVLKQVKACYSENRKHKNPLQLCLTSFNEEVKELFLKLQPGLVNWNLRMEDSNYVDVFGKENIVYLTSDSTNILSTLDEDKVYVIGGFVDHNQHKGLCYKKAEENLVAHAQLPIDNFVKMSSRKVLTINHVFEILLHYSESNDWKDAFLKILPNRKGISDICDGNNLGKDAESCTNDNNGDIGDMEGEEERLNIILS